LTAENACSGKRRDGSLRLAGDGPSTQLTTTRYSFEPRHPDHATTGPLRASCRHSRSSLWSF